MRINNLMTVALLSCLAACSNDEAENINKGQDNAALFTGSIEKIQSRAYDQTWDSSDRIGISGTSGEKPYTNICYLHQGDNTFKADNKNIYYQNNEPVTFTAYYPWNANLTESTTITADTHNQIDQRKFDYLYATAQGDKRMPVNFLFHHKMAKLVLIVKAGADVTYTDVEGAACSLANFLHQGTFDRTTGATVPTGKPSAQWTFVRNATDIEYNTPTIEKKNADGAIAYTLILFPQTFSSANGNLSFTAAIDKSGFSTDIDFSRVLGNGGENELKAGKQYNITINLNKTRVSVGESTISPWEELTDEVDAVM